MFNVGEKMRVLFITNCPSPYRVRFFNELSKYCELTVVFEMEAARNRDSEWKSSEDFLFNAVFMKSLFMKEESAFCSEVTKYIDKYKRDVIVVGGYSTPTGMYSILYMKAKRIPFILNCDGGLIKADTFIKKSIKRFFIGSAKIWLSTGKTSDEYLCYYGANRQKILQYPFTSIKEDEVLNVSELQKKEMREKLGIKQDKVVLYVGRFIPLKRIDVLVNACKELQDVAVVLVGGDDLETVCGEDIRGEKSNIYVVGFKSAEELKEYYQAADIFVLPTSGDVWGLVINEAMAMGLPVITTEKCVAGIELVEQGKNGYIVSVGNSDEMKEKIEILLNDLKLRENIKKNNIVKIGQYTIEKMAIRHIEIFKEYMTNIRE